MPKKFSAESVPTTVAGLPAQAAPSPSRENAATESEDDPIAYSDAPSAVSATAREPSSPRPSVHSPPEPSSETQPASPAFWVSAPVTGSRSKIPIEPTFSLPV